MTIKCEFAHEEFYAVKNELEEARRKFTRKQMKRLCFRDLFLSICGNAGKAIGQFEDMEQEQVERLKRFKGRTAGELNCAVFCDRHEMYAAFDRLSEEAGPLTDEEASPEILLYRNMLRLRGNWSDRRGSRYLSEIYRLIPICAQRGVLPGGWLGAVKLNADTFDGHFNDGRIMRDGRMYMPQEAINAIGLPPEMASGVSGSLAKMMGAKHKPGEYRGSYEELLEEILTPEQRVQFVRSDGRT